MKNAPTPIGIRTGQGFPPENAVLTTTAIDPPIMKPRERIMRINQPSIAENIQPPKNLMAANTMSEPIPIGRRMSFWVKPMKVQRSQVPKEPQAIMIKPVNERAKKDASFQFIVEPQWQGLQDSNL